MQRPSGTVTFLFTDIEGSTRLWAEYTNAMDRAVARHDDLVRGAVEAHAGYVFATGGDGFGAAFDRPDDAIAAAVDSQVALESETWDGLPESLRSRIGVHTGEATERGGDYFGPDVNLAARVTAAAWGGQILCTNAVVEVTDVPVAAIGEHRLRDVPGTTALHQVLVPSIRADFPAPRTLDVAPSTLPAQRTSFVGRQDDIDAVRRLLLDHRLVTLAGWGGTGKTRLAIEVAGREAPRRPGGTYFVDLAPLDSGEHVMATVARACLVPADPARAPADQLVDSIADRSALVVLDNCEHVVDAAAEVVDLLLASCANVGVIATSREALELRGEQLYLLDPLDAVGTDARGLFVERASEAGGGRLDPDSEAIVGLCARLDGIPLAIELAAARTRTLTPVQIRERLDQQLDVLGANKRGTPDRHQTLRATIDWSYQLLDAEERSFFDQLGVFAGSFDLPAAAGLIGDDQVRAGDLLEGLVTRSMVTVTDPVDDRRRFRLLDTLRTFATEKLNERPGAFDAAIAAHTAHYLSRLTAVPVLKLMSRDLHVEFEPDLANARSAFDHADRTPSAGLLPQAAIPFTTLLANMDMINEARAVCDGVLERTEIEDVCRGKLLVARSFMDATEDGSSAFAQSAGEALRYLQPGDGVWAAAIGLTSIPMQMFASAHVVPTLEEAGEALDGLVENDADFDRATLDFYLGGALMNSRRFGEATDVFARSADLLTNREPTSLVRLWSASGVAIGQTLLGRPEEALETLDAVSSLADWTDWAVEWAFARSLALAHCRPMDEARRPLQAIGVRFGRDRPSSLAATVVVGFGVLAAIEGRSERAAELFALPTATRSPASTAAMYEIIGRLEGWSDDDFANRKLSWAMVAGGQQEGMDRDEFFACLSALAHDEATMTA